MKRRTILTGLGVVAVGGGGYFVTQGRSPTQTVRKMWEKIDSGDVDASNEYIHPDADFHFKEQFSVSIETLKEETASEIAARDGVEESPGDVENEVANRTEGVTYSDQSMVYNKLIVGENDEEVTGYFLLVNTDEWLILEDYQLIT